MSRVRVVAVAAADSMLLQQRYILYCPHHPLAWSRPPTRRVPQQLSKDKETVSTAVPTLVPPHSSKATHTTLTRITYYPPIARRSTGVAAVVDWVPFRRIPKVRNPRITMPYPYPYSSYYIQTR